MGKHPAFLHLDEFDHDEVMYVVLQFFGSGKQFSQQSYSFNGSIKTDNIVFEFNKTGSLRNVITSETFSEISKKTIENNLIRDLSKGNEYVGQDVIFCDEKITGCFKYKDLFQIFPIKNYRKVFTDIAEQYPCLLEFKYFESPNLLIDATRRKEKAVLYTRILNLLINQNLRLQPTDLRSHWVVNRTSVPSEVSYDLSQEQYFPPEFLARKKDFSDLVGIPEIERVPSHIYYLTSPVISSEPLRIPSDLISSIDCFFALSESDRKKFLLSCSWYSMSSDLWKSSQSSAFISLVTSLECLMEKEKAVCKCCGQPVYRVNYHFKRFLHKFFPEIDHFPTEERTLYETRSGLAHGINLLQRDSIPWRMHIDIKRQQEDTLSRNLFFICGTAIYNWLRSRN